MYFGPGTPLDFIFARGTWIFLGICVILAIWKLIDIAIWLYSHIDITWS